jgi:hypothetical protein
MTKVLYAGIAFVATVLTVIGLVIDKGATIVNLLTEGIGLRGNIVVGFTLIEYWTRRRLALKWSEVRSQTLYGITMRLCEFLWDCYLAAGIEFRRRNSEMIGLYSGDASIQQAIEYADELARCYGQNAQAQVFGHVKYPSRLSMLPRKVRWVAGLPQDYRQKLKILFDKNPAPLPDELIETASSGALCETSRMTLGYVRDVYLPQVVSLADDPVLVEQLMRVEQKRLLWISNAKVSEMSVVPHSGGWETLPVVIYAVRDVLSYLHSIGIVDTHLPMIEAV